MFKVNRSIPFKKPRFFQLIKILVCTLNVKDWLPFRDITEYLESRWNKGRLDDKGGKDALYLQRVFFKQKIECRTTEV